MSAGDATSQEPLRLTSVLLSALPLELGTSAAPDRYTVPVVFSRQVTPQERERIEDPQLARRLGEPLGAELELVVSDRRLLVKNTSLAELRDGLAAALATAWPRRSRRPCASSTCSWTRSSRRAASRRADVEHERADAVAREAAQIRFE